MLHIMSADVALINAADEMLQICFIFNVLVIAIRIGTASTHTPIRKSFTGAGNNADMMLIARKREVISASGLWRKKFMRIPPSDILKCYIKYFKAVSGENQYFSDIYAKGYNKKLEKCRNIHIFNKNYIDFFA